MDPETPIEAEIAARVAAEMSGSAPEPLTPEQIEAKRQWIAELELMREIERWEAEQEREEARRLQAQEEARQAAERARQRQREAAERMAQRDREQAVVRAAQESARRSAATDQRLARLEAEAIQRQRLEAERQTVARLGQLLNPPPEPEPEVIEVENPLHPAVAGETVQIRLAAVMAWHLMGEELRWLLTGPQLRAYLEGRGVTMRADIPATGEWRGQVPPLAPRSWLALDPLSAFDGLNGNGIGIDAKAKPRQAVGGPKPGHVHESAQLFMRYPRQLMPLSGTFSEQHRVMLER